MYQVNQLSESLLGTRLLPYHHVPSQHNAIEYFGVEYFYIQAGRQFVYTTSPADDEMLDELDEGFVDESMIVLTVGAGAPGEEEEEEEEDLEDEVCAM